MNIWQKMSSAKRIIAVVGILAVVVAIPVTLTLVQTEQDNRQRAAEPAADNTIYELPPITMVAGDANNDGDVNSLDFEVMRSCFNDESTCDDDSFFGSDLNDDSYVDLLDLNLFIREFANQSQ